MSVFNEIKKQINKYPGLVNIIDEIAPFENKLTNLHQYGMVLFGPDSFKQSEVLNIINYFTSKGFCLIAIRTKRINKTETENLFLPTSTCVECGTLRWWMIQDSASIGEFSAAIFYSETATSDFNCLNQLNQYKGNSNPLKNKIGVVRYDFKAINICLNLIHIPDIYGDFFKDTSPFYHVSELFSIILKQNKEVLNKKLENDLFFVHLCSNNNGSYNFEMISYKIKYLLAKCFDFSLSTINIDELLDHYRYLYTLFKEEVKHEKRHDMFISNIILEKDILTNLQEKIVKYIKCNQDNNLNLEMINAYSICELLLVLTDPSYFANAGNDFFYKLHFFNLFIEPYEQLIINTTLFQWKKIEGGVI